jgi:prolyl-tRNA synthetase
MRWTQAFIPTLKEDPAEAEVASHKLMIRAGMLRKVAPGIHDYLPLGWRVIKKVENIVREEMDRAGAQELLLPANCPAELWQRSGRYDAYGPELLRYKDRAEHELVFGPTHEEVITDLVDREVKSYRELPVNLYQIQTKFRDEIRPRFGVLRAREFCMKDAYSFHASKKSLDQSYKEMFEAYNRICQRCGVLYRAIQAEGGTIGGSYTEEFMVLAERGEDGILVCKCGYAGKPELVAVKQEQARKEVLGDGTPEQVATPDKHTVEEVAAFLKQQPEQVVKTMIYSCGEEAIAVLVRGDHEVSEAKLTAHCRCEVQMADAEEIKKLTGGPLGFSGPVGLKNIKLIADASLRWAGQVVTGANRQDAHLKGVVLERDAEISEWLDLRHALPADPCPKCAAPLGIKRGIEVGHVFKLGTKYSEAMKATFIDKSGKEQPYIMGCYGFGVTRMVAAIIEQLHDEHGITWPVSVAPYSVIISPLNMAKPALKEAGEKIYSELLQAGVEVILDDREVATGVKLNDADLIGVPLRVTIGERSLKEGKVELKLRREKEPILVSPEEATNKAIEILEAEQAKLEPRAGE